MLVSCITAMILVTGLHAQTEISLLPEKESIYVTPGANVSVVCIASGLNGKPIRWDHAGKQIANVAPSTVLYSDPAYKDKYAIGLADSDGGNFTFTVLGFSPDDDVGSITCTVAGVDPLSIQLESLIVPDQVVMTVNSAHREQAFNDTHSSVVFDLRYQSSISCAVTNSRPVATVTWFWNGNDTASSLLNITDDKQASGDLYNVTSTILLPLRYLRYNEVAKENVTVDDEETQNVTVIEWPVLEENFGSDNVAAPEELSSAATDHTLTHGVVSCQATVGDRTFVKSLIIDFSEYGNSGSQVMPTFRLLISCIASVLTCVIETR